MNPKVYIETTIISHLTAWRSSQLIMAANGMDYLLTWNCRHIANATLRNAMADVCRAAGYEMPIICTPLELIQEFDHD